MRLSQLENADSPISVTPFPKFTLFKFTQLANAHFLISTTLSGIFIVISLFPRLSTVL